LKPILTFIGKVVSPLKTIEDCPLQEGENAPEVFIEVYAKYAEAASGLKSRAKILIFTWLHKANRQTLTTHPRNDENAMVKGVFATRSPARPNPIGIHVAEILEIKEGRKIKISNLEVINGTPVIDIKPHL
jgi:tRNA-Thr(GGU) m(6)t(6)A37 methyltransferase TsaA